MTAQSSNLHSPGLAAGAVFDRLAPTYDHEFTDSLIGRAQRQAVWKILLDHFQPGDNILELNCGTGEDALFLARHNISVFACDASQQMIVRAEHRLERDHAPLSVVFCHLPTERIDELNPAVRFDGMFSNFSGLNCVEDLSPVAASLARLVKPGSHLLLCLSTRVCLTEILYYLACGQLRKALRRVSGSTSATLDGASLTVFYPRIPQVERAFAPHFRLRARTGIGVAIPPSYLEPWVRRHPHLFQRLCLLESLVARIPLLRSTGDHVLLDLERSAQ